MAVVAPPTDPPGALIDAQIASIVALIAQTAPNSPVQTSYAQDLNAWQVAAVDHYMVTGWLNAAAVLAVFSAPTWDRVGQDITKRVAFLQNLYNVALVTPMPPGNANGYGDSGWTTIAASYLQTLYAKQIELVEHIMALPGGTSAATMLSTLTGVQTAPGGIPFEYVFVGVGFDDFDIDD